MFLKTHGNYKIIDYADLIENGNIDNNYYVNWGVEDSKVFEAAKDELLALSKKQESFNLSILTSDTHPIEGYFDEGYCKYDENYTHLENAYKCTSIIVSDFIKWLHKQKFYDNTTIVVLGDHLAMYNNNLHNDMPNNYNRSIYNVFINSKVKNTCDNNYKWSTLDLYPSILSAMGAKIENEKLGFGTNVFSCKETIYDKYLDFNQELFKKSKYYNKCIVANHC